MKYVSIKLAIALVITCLLGAIYFEYKNSVWSLFKVVSEEDDSRYIAMDGNVAVMPAVLDYKVYPPYIVGIRLPSEQMLCSGYSSIVLKNKKIYFVLNLSSKKLEEFDNKQKFKKRLLDFGGRSEEIDYSRFEDVWNDYNRHYNNFSSYDDCK